MSWTAQLKPVTVNGRPYLVSEIRRAGKYGSTTIPVDYVNWWATRDGEIHGPSRSANRRSRPGTVGRAIFDAAEAEEQANGDDPSRRDQ